MHTTTWLPLPRAEVFDFFADAANLERITPPELAFEIVTPQPFEIGEGTLIDYRLGLFGVRFGWRTEIVSWAPPYRFVDQQLEGPYRRWHHTHTFADAPDQDGHPGTRMDDEVLWELPVAPLGELAYPLVRAQLARIFSYRQRRIEELLSDG
ncbi:SRPBCC family protein [Rubrivirga sp. IMCC45206]|uniref:SRPBCC family protein n=1 Tax=Rubrivirga sp. IMCC45206 TaxID=3391614 RepID=UPI00398FC3CA